jgi:hypothetical protein
MNVVSTGSDVTFTATLPYAKFYGYVEGDFGVEVTRSNGEKDITFDTADFELTEVSSVTDAEGNVTWTDGSISVTFNVGSEEGRQKVALLTTKDLSATGLGEVYTKIGSTTIKVVTVATNVDIIV